MGEQTAYGDTAGIDGSPPQCSGIRPATTAALTRGIRRFLVARGGVTVTELRLASGRRADIVALDGNGLLTIVEIKSGLEDLKADSKWSGYVDYCDLFYFGVSPDFPLAELPDDTGIIIGDSYDGHIYRDCAVNRLAPARRKAMTIRFAQAAAARLLRFEDPADPTAGSRTGQRDKFP